MKFGRSFVQGAMLDGVIQTGANWIYYDDFSTAIKEIDYADIAVSGAINTITGGTSSIRSLFRNGTRIAIIKGTTIATLEITSAAFDWKPFAGSDKFVSIFDGSKSKQHFFCEFVLNISGNVLPDEMVKIFKRWAKSDFDMRWYSIMTSSQRMRVKKIYDIINSNSFKTTLETNTSFLKSLLQIVINNDEVKLKTIKVESFVELPVEYNDNTNYIMPETYD
jgi:hypothetical protein